jgi:aminoglycoside phosphotransferase (APT) family kinase protein
MGAARSIGTAIERLRSGVGALAGVAAATGTTHGDLSPSNVLIDGAGRVAIIDPNDVPGPVVADLAKLICAARTAPARLVSGIPRRRGESAIDRAVLDAYGDAIDLRVYALYRSMSVASRWINVEEAAASGVRRGLLGRARRVLQAELAGALSDVGVGGDASV